MKSLRKIIQIDEALCNGCGECVPACAEGALVILDGKARLAAERYCDGLGDCLGKCPVGALSIIDAEADPFDESAVAAMLAAREIGELVPPSQASSGAGCPGTRLMIFEPFQRTAEEAACACSANPTPLDTAAGYGLTHWPIKLRLVPPDAPFLKQTDLLLAADCAPPALADFQTAYLSGRALLLGCPKFDDPAEMVDRLAAILRRNAPRTVTVLRMDVPCCGAFERILQAAIRQAGTTPTVNTVVIRRDLAT